MIIKKFTGKTEAEATEADEKRIGKRTGDHECP